MRIDAGLTGVVGQGRSLNANSGWSVNCYLEQTADGKTIMVGTPGLIPYVLLPNAPVRGCYSDNSFSYWVAGNTLYMVDAAQAITTLGTLDTINGRVEFASSGVDLLIVDGTSGYSLKLATNVFTKITAAGFPASPVSCVFLSGFFVVAPVNSQKFYVSATVNIATNWNALDFATAEGKPDVTLGLASYQGELIPVGFKSLEVWGVTGNVDFPFQRNNSAVIDHGCIAAKSVGKCMDSMYWLGGDDLGRGIVWRLNGYSPERVSTHEIEQQIAALPMITDAYAITYQQEGHVFYCLQFPSSNKTLVFDATTNQWHERCYRDPTTGDYKFWRLSCACFSGSYILGGDIETGRIYRVDLDTYTDNGAEIPRIRESTVFNQSQTNLFFSELIVNMETGVGLNNLPVLGGDPLLMLQWSNDYGHTWSNWRFKQIGKIGKYGTRVKFNGLGMGRNRVWRLKMTDPVKFILLGSTLEVEQALS